VAIAEALNLNEADVRLLATNSLTASWR
jgi:hypothetical protein